MEVPKRRFGSENRLDFRLDRDVGGGKTVDGIAGAVDLVKAEEASDMVVLFVAAEEALGFFLRQLKRGQRDGRAVFRRKSVITIHQFAEFHHDIGRSRSDRRSAARNFCIDGSVLRISKSVARTDMEVKEIRPDQARAGASSGGVAGGGGLSAEAGSAMMAGGNPQLRKE